MPPEIDDSKPKNEPPPLIDFFSFHQGAAKNEKTSPGNTGGQKSIELTDPFSYHQGLSALSKALDGQLVKRAGQEQDPAGVVRDKLPDNVECVDGKCRLLSPEEVKAKKAKETSKGEAKDRG